MTLTEAYLAIAPRWEGESRTLYQDTEGYLTVGDGLLLPSLAAALMLPFQVNGKAATPDQITAEWERVRAMPRGLRASAYATANSPSLAVAEIRDLLEASINATIADLTRLLPCFVQIPFAWQLGVLDMGFNLGAHGLIDKFPHFVIGVETCNAMVCAAQCNRPQLSKARNDWTRAQFGPQ